MYILIFGRFTLEMILKQSYLIAYISNRLSINHSESLFRACWLLHQVDDLKISFLRNAVAVTMLTHCNERTIKQSQTSGDNWGRDRAKIIKKRHDDWYLAGNKAIKRRTEENLRKMTRKSSKTSWHLNIVSLDIFETRIKGNYLAGQIHIQWYQQE